LTTTLVINFMVAMLAIVNPIGKIPIWIRACEGQDGPVRMRLAAMLVLTAFVILAAALAFGRSVLEFFGISLAAFRIGGGIVILVIGLQMLNGDDVQFGDTRTDGDADAYEQAKARFRDVIVPLAVPILAGPGSISTAIVYGSVATDWASMSGMIFALAALMALVLVLLMAARWIQSVVGEMVLEVQTRLFGLVLAAIAAQLVVEGLGEVFPRWVTPDSPIADVVYEGDPPDGSGP
jgi:multiple antibiotic resistance protein